MGRYRPGNRLLQGIVGLIELPAANPIIAKILTVGAPCRRESRLQTVYALQGAPTERYQKLTSGEFQKPHQIVIASCKSWGETNYQAVSYATVGQTC
jgi:hypothetical protein